MDATFNYYNRKEVYARTAIGLEQITGTFLEFAVVISMGYIDHAGCLLTQMTQTSQ